MARLMEDECTRLVVEGAGSEPLSDLGDRHPMVLSCGGIFIPRPNMTNSNNALYQVINLANDKEPTKLVNSGAVKSLLRDILHKESMN